MASLHRTTRMIGGKKVTYPTWRGSYKDADGQWKKVSLYRDKAASKAKLQELQRQADLRRAGVVTPVIEHAAKPITVHLEEYLDDLAGQNVSPDHLRNAKTRLAEITDLGGWVRLGDITADSMSNVLALLARRNVSRSRDKELKLATTTVNSFLKHARAFVHWLVARGRLMADPLRSLKRPDERRAIKRRARRALTMPEIGALLTAAPPNRALIYKFILLTGLRRKEAHHLLVADVHLDPQRPYLQRRSQQTKNARAAQVPLHGDLVSELRRLITGRRPTERAFKAIPEVRTLERDLAKAGVPFVDDLGRRADLHAQRHTYGTLLALSGAPMMVAKELMRHEDPRLTANVYTHVGLQDGAQALAKVQLPAVQTPDSTATQFANVGKTVFAEGRELSVSDTPPAGDQYPIEPAQVREFIMRYGTTVATRLAVSLIDLLGGTNPDTVEKSGPRSSVG